jgi:two-component system phosphate regulon response regulator PhoB
MPIVLLVSGDGAVREMTSRHLTAKGYDVLEAANATEACRSLLNLTVDAIIFDTAVVDMSAGDFCHWLGQDPYSADVPILFLVPASFRWLPGAVPLRTGRDALASKPLDLSEIELALAGLLSDETATASETLRLAGLCLHRDSFSLSAEGGSVTLTPTEFRLLEYLMERPGRVVATDELLDKIWGFFAGTGSHDIVRSHMRNLRAKIHKVYSVREVIRTFPRRGYRFSS